MKSFVVILVSRVIACLIVLAISTVVVTVGYLLGLNEVADRIVAYVVLGCLLLWYLISIEPKVLKRYGVTRYWDKK